MIEGLDLWDMWPLALADGSPAEIMGAELWMILASPKFDDPDQRHDHARIRLIHGRSCTWRDCGDALPDGFSPGAREWSGSAVLSPETGAVTLYFTAAGRPGHPELRFEQRLFQTHGVLDTSGALPAIMGWSTPAESVTSDGLDYVRTESAPLTPGMIKGFRDPGFFRDPVDGRDYLLFTGSKAGSSHSHNGLIGLAQSDGKGAWSLQPPILDADGLCNEMERPHIVHQGGLYYLFWSSQSAVFAPSGPFAPTGLYGMVAPSVRGPFRPLNGSGLVICNPAASPQQAYCWWVTPDLKVASFVDKWQAPPGERKFGGVLAPELQLCLEGETTRLVTKSAWAAA